MSKWTPEKTFRFNYLKSIESRDKLTSAQVGRLVRFGVEERDASANGYFLAPCIKSIGVLRVHDLIMKFYRKENLLHKVGALRLFYWNQYPTFTANKALAQCHAQKSAIEYEQRKKVLIPDLLACKNLAVKFYYHWALRDETTKSRYLKNVPSNFDDLLVGIKNDSAAKALIQKLYPEIQLN